LRAEVTDPVSGFFMVRRSVFDDVAPRLSDQGFKILFDLIASRRQPLRILELPYAFSPRTAGSSKLDARVAADYLGLILARMSGNLIPPRALLFFAVGATGVAVNLVALKLLLMLKLGFVAAQFLSSVTAMTTNYLINNEVTYSDRRLRGLALIGGYGRFCALCAVGLAANLAVADLAQRAFGVWWLSGLAGILMGAVWNYMSTSLAVW
jgi:dolichol-phosphate mannosyltransferase